MVMSRGASAQAACSDKGAPAGDLVVREASVEPHTHTAAAEASLGFPTRVSFCFSMSKDLADKKVSR
jgi:hypothetical protein